MPNGKGVMEIVVKLADGSVVTINADATAGLQAIYFDVAAAIAAGIPMGSGPTPGITVSTKKAVSVAGTTMSAMDTATTDTTICYYVNGVLVCVPA